MSLTNFPLLDRQPLAYEHRPAEKAHAPGPPPQQAATEQEAKAISPVVLVGTVRIVEFVLILLVGVAVHAFWVYPTDGWTNLHLAAELAVPSAALVFFQAIDIYNVAAFRTHVHQLARLTAAWTLVFLVALALSFFAKHQNMYSRAWIGGWYAGGLIVLFAWRIALGALVRHWADAGRLIRQAVIVGGGPPGEALVHAINAEAHTDLRISGIFDDRSDDRSPPIVAGVPRLGTVDDLVRFTRRHRVDVILVSLPLTAEARVLQMVRKLWVLPVDVRLAAHMNRLRFRPRAYSYIGNVPVLDIFDKPIGDWNLAVKSLFDRVVGGLLLLALAPLMAVVAVAIKLDSKGPVLFRQRRHGFNNQVIEVLKFRTLHHQFADPGAKRLVVRGDPRVTRVGRFLRNTSIDELPQLFNVLRGELSLVGPRPHALNAPIADKLWEDVVDEYFARHRVKPGMTGWAQINGWRGGLDTPEKLQRRIDHDLYYIENWSLLFDTYILLMTPLALLKAQNAY
ncbi:MAG: undecaprenyl-phosphate glucose phosphotransferase [Xanthobacteraceae bacterium]